MKKKQTKKKVKPSSACYFNTIDFKRKRTEPPQSADTGAHTLTHTHVCTGTQVRIQAAAKPKLEKETEIKFCFLEL